MAKQHRLSNIRGITAFDNDKTIADCLVCGTHIRIVWNGEKPACKNKNEEAKERQKENQKRYRQKQLDLNRRRRLAKYGMTNKEYKALFDAQNGKCGICEKEWRSGEPSLTIHVSPENNKVQGLLCSICNWHLATIGGSVESVMRIVDYLNRTPVIDKTISSLKKK